MKGNKTTPAKKGKSIYLSKEIWSALEKVAAKEERSVNYIVERAVKVEVGILIPSDIKKLKPVKVKVK